MKHVIFFLLVLCSSIGLIAQEPSQNYIHTRTFLTEDGTRYLDNIQYVDGLGHPFMNVRKGITPTGSNLMTLQEYDGAGRESNTWLPHVTSTNYIDPATFKSQVSATYGGDTRPYHQPVYEASPLNRIVKRYGPGAAWANHPVSTDYLTNTASGELSCTLYTINQSDALATTGNYSPATLYVTKTTDEDGHVSYTFTDMRDHTILVRQMNEGEANDTYYVYDDFENLRFVLPPMYQEIPSLELYAYQYKYDSRNRCIEKKLPGCQLIKYYYDQTDNLIFSQDGVQCGKGEWTFFLYDVFHRLTVQGVCTNSNASTVKDLIVNCLFTASDTGLGNSGYTSGFTLTTPVIHQVNYYDTYKFTELNGFKSKGQFHNGASTANAIGLPTGGITTLFGIAEKVYSAIYYDIKANPIQTIATNHLGGHEITNTTCSFTGKPLTVKHVHSAAGKASQTEIYTYEYDHAERLTKVIHRLNNVFCVLAENTYDDFGRLQIKKQNGTLGISTYRYNIRDWLTEIRNTNFIQKLYYHTGNGLPCYNGNISSMTWKSGAESTIRGYKYRYDGLSRLTTATYGESDALNVNVGRFSENITSYDRHGNVKSLQRNGKQSSVTYGIIDNLTLEHNGNQLKSVNDVGTDPLYNGALNFVDGVKQLKEYYYDKNGSLTQDMNKNIGNIQYNSLNLPTKITFKDGKQIDYLYGADGVKRQVKHYTSTPPIIVPSGVKIDWELPEVTPDPPKNELIIDYCGSMIYENGSLSKILTEEGYITFQGTKSTYHYYLKDHQGNNRVVIKQDGTVEQVNHYYPFGGLFGEGIDTGKQNYKFGSKELDRMHGLDWYDFAARPYDPVWGGGFPTMDPLCEKYYSVSPYVYCNNNPVRLIDPTGEGWDEAWPYLKQSVSGKISFGIQAGGELEYSGAKLGLQINGGSIEFSKEGQKLTKGVIVSAGIVSVSGYKKTFEENVTMDVIEDGTIISVPLWEEDYKTITTYDKTGQCYKEIDRKETTETTTGKANISFSSSFFVGFEASLDLDDLLNFVVALFE